MKVHRYVTPLALSVALGYAEQGALYQSAEYENRTLGFYPNVTFHTSDLPMPMMNIMKWDDRCDSDDLIFLNPNVGHLRWEFSIIADQKGHMIWGSSVEGNQRNLQVVQYRGRDYLAVWNSRNDTYRGPTYYQIYNNAYEEAFRIFPTRELSGDHHGFTITADDTALFLVYSAKQWDLRSFGVEDGWINDAHFQEINVETGELLFEWRATDHFRPEDMSLISLKKHFENDGTMHRAWDAFHINSMQKDSFGNYLISMRYNNAVTYVNGKTGNVIWQLGGKNNSFSISPGSPADTLDFMGNHDAKFIDERTVTLFDNQAWGFGNIGSSRGLKLSIDVKTKVASLVTAYNHPDKLIAESQGSHRVLDNGHSFIGWGHVSGYSEFSEGGELLCDTHFGPVLINNGEFIKSGRVQSYRVFKQRWVGEPSYPPSVALVNETLYVSWNGATEVKRWKLEGSASETDETEIWHHIDTRVKTGFETDMRLLDSDYVAWRLTAIGAQGKKLGAWRFNKDGKLSSLAATKIFSSQNLVGHVSMMFYLVLICVVVVFLAFFSRSGIEPIRTAAEEIWAKFESRLQLAKSSHSAGDSKYQVLLDDGDEEGAARPSTQ